MNQSNQKKSSIYLLVLFTVASLFTFSSCKDDAKEATKLDYASLMVGNYEGNISVGEDVSFDSKATISAGSTSDEITFTETSTDSTTTFKIELVDLSSQKAVALRIPGQTIQGTAIVGIALDTEDPQGTQGYFFYQDENEEKINEITFLITANNGNYYYNYTKVE
ncbi:hypothetical protein Fleli_3711 [Bernardetia litoralis DSM 6794]|uniref:Lipocalin-like domain-containing protein n=1 Tax=Bernardetia litoralis (strain ATCC 23117 / DSM 6794 / NBRC 15988 / NCIMB 1366 / Fx l1 / Sio-4) TaxID=880071 RepID=I4APY8_BERLS|nr:hypothetical protein [Bernardetia litoralis]AFM06023.1 hypothetical protein Fleli_3711 [Bernardetia litoralis DSM 6794]